MWRWRSIRRQVRAGNGASRSGRCSAPRADFRTRPERDEVPRPFGDGEDSVVAIGAVATSGSAGADGGAAPRRVRDGEIEALLPGRWATGRRRGRAAHDHPFLTDSSITSIGIDNNFGRFGRFPCARIGGNRRWLVVSRLRGGQIGRRAVDAGPPGSERPRGGAKQALPPRRPAVSLPRRRIAVHLERPRAVPMSLVRS